MGKTLAVKLVGLMIGAIWFCASTTAWAGADLKRLNRLNGVSIYSGDGETRIVARFSKSWELKATPVFYEKSIQLDLKGVYVEPAKQKFSFHDPLVSSALAYQFTPTTTRLRFFLSADPRSFSKRWAMERNAERMILVLKKATPQMVKHEPAKAAQMAQSPLPAHEPEAAVIAGPGAKTLTITPKINAALHRLTEKPAHVFVAKKEEAIRRAPRKSTGFLEYKAPEAPEAPGMGKMAIKMISSLSMVLALVFAIAWVAKKYMRGQGALPGQSATVIKVLAVGAIGPRQQVKVVDVAGKILVLGITGDSLTLLSKIEEPEDVDKLIGLAAPRNKPFGRRGHDKKPESTLGALMNVFRIGRIRTPPGAPPALLDEKDPDTFAGKMALAEKTGVGAGAARADRMSRDDLVRKVTNAIREKNGNLRIA